MAARQYVGFIFLLLLILLGCRNKQGQGEMTSVIPEPASVELGKGYFVFSGETVWASDDEMYNDILSDFSDLFEKSAGFTLEMSGNLSSADLVIYTDTTLSAEAYVLSVSPRRITVNASGRRGAFYALQTLRQLLPAELESYKVTTGVKWKVPVLTIKDEPRFEYRGLMLDVSRYFIPKETILKVLDAASVLKINKFHLHLVDDQGWRLEIKKYPKLTEVGAWRVYREGPFSLRKNPMGPGEVATVGGFYTQDDIREIVAFAARRQIEVIPEIEMPAHTNSSLVAYPEYKCPSVKHYTAVLPGMGGVNFNTEYCAGNDETFVFLQNILDEVMALFPSKYVHLGGDEANKEAWKICPKCQKRMRELGISNVDDLQGYFMDRMTKYVQSKGKVALGWDEWTNSKIPDGAVIMAWQGLGEAGYEAAKQGNKFIMTPSQIMYLSYYQGPQWFEPRAYFGNNTLKDIYEYEPVQQSWTADVVNNLWGVQGSLWTEFVESPAAVEYMIFPRIAALAEVSWTQLGSKNWPGFVHRLDKLLTRWDYMGIDYAKSMYNLDHKITPENGKLVVRLSCIRPDVEIRYTLDGSEPIATSTLFQDFLLFSDSVMIKAAAFMKDVRKGEVLTLPVHWNKATAKQVLGNSNPELYMLTNGLKGSDKHTDMEWCGWYDQDVSFVLDLGKVMSVHKVLLGHVVNYGMGVHYPASVELFVSADNKNFVSVDKMTFSTMEIFKDGIFTDELIFDGLSTEGRYLKFVLKSPGKTPQFHHRTGQGVWLRFDEIVVL